jgi:hypothetical protein
MKNFVRSSLIIIQVNCLMADPKIDCSEAVFDFGSRDASEVVSHTFELKNTGTSDLVIKAVRPACGCTTAQLDKSVIPPGESSKLGAQLSLAGRSGEVQKPILIESNDPANPALQLTFKGVVGADFEFVPSILTLRKDSPESPATATTILRSLKNEPLEILNAKSNSGKLKIRWDKLPDVNAFQITANLEGRFQLGQYGDKIVLETNHPIRKQIEISVIIIVPAPISVAPLKIVLDAGASEPVSRTIILKNPTNEALQIDKIETPETTMTSKIETMGNFGSRVIIGNIIPKSDLAENSIRIILSSGRVIRIPFALKEKP